MEQTLLLEESALHGAVEQNLPRSILLSWSLCLECPVNVSAHREEEGSGDVCLKNVTLGIESYVNR